MKKIKIKVLILSAFIAVCSISSVFPASASDTGSLSDIYLSADVSSITIGALMLPADSTERSDTLAMQLLGLSSGFTADNTEILIKSAGLETVDMVNYDKDDNDSQHNCAFAVAQGVVYKNFMPESALVITVRGTNGGEWYSNFDFCPSHSEDALFSENFLFCAEDVFSVFKEYYQKYNPSDVIICGHSRGAACANLLGLLIDNYIGNKNVYVYTFASPTTIRSDTETEECENIFNYINPCDLIPGLPLTAWNFKRAGTDIILSVDDTNIEKEVSDILDTLADIAPSVSSYYSDRHSITSDGLSDEGVTAFEMMLLVSNRLLNASNDTDSDQNLDQLQETMLSEDSDLYPLTEIFNRLSENDYELGTAVLMQHLPDKYKELIERYMKENKTS